MVKLRAETQRFGGFGRLGLGKWEKASQWLIGLRISTAALMVFTAAFRLDLGLSYPHSMGC